MPPQSMQGQAGPVTNITQIVLPQTDINAELARDGKVFGPAPLRFAVQQKVRISPSTDGTWEEVAGGRLWRLRFVSVGATDLNFGFTTFWLPEGATLHVISESQNYYQGPYTAVDNQSHRQLWTPIVPGDAAVIELFVPSRATERPELVLTQVGTGYRDLFRQSKGTGIPKSEGCEIDVVCPQAAPWTNQIRSVCRIQIGGSELCTATLIMDAPGDFRPFLLTANHCGLSAASAPTVVAYWNCQSSSCGQHGIGASYAQNQSGAIFRAAKVDVDFSLVELNSLPSPSFKVYYAAWDRSGTPAGGGVGIHHPNGQGKCISFSSNPLTTVDNCIGTGGTATHWQVIWTQGVTEPGSSGSAIFDPISRQVLGTLSGGSSDCSTQQGPDCYGKFSLAWDTGTFPAARLRDWLDPANTGVSTVTGANGRLVPLINSVQATLVSEGCAPTNGVIDPGEMVTVSFALKNTGALPTTNLVATLQSSGGVNSPSAPQVYGVLPTSGSVVTRSFRFVASGDCGGLINPVLTLSEGTNDLGVAAFELGLGKGTVTFRESFDRVGAPALPPDWATSGSAGNTWYTVSSRSDSAPNSAFTIDAGSVSDAQLVSPIISITNPLARVFFRHSFDTEDGYDGGILEISIAGDPFADIVAAGGSFAAGGYTGSIPLNYNNPLGGSDAWTGSSGGFQTVLANLPPSAAGQPIQLRWRFGSDVSNGGIGWYVDSVSIIDGYTCCANTVSPPTLEDLTVSESGTFGFTVTGTPGYSYVVESSTILTDWVRVATNAAPFTFTDTNAKAIGRRFYRAVSQP